MQYEDIVAMFSRDIENQGYDIEWVFGLDVPAITQHKRELIISSKECCTPFYLQHELIHILFKHVGRLNAFNGNDERNPNEAEANKNAIFRILTFHRDHNWEPNVQNIMEWYGIPSYLENEVECQIVDVYEFTPYDNGIQTMHI
ncbi:hypothetical protein LIX87_08095 [Weissella viridescens]|uniref:hypothetical protein n=1 Tax=Weissella viridescens TaxID=1629 RepID=UPI001D0675D8|nr:hypothetical protein [Weissella viridescens]MCB6840927.1 hypothetical protein [Weissella viridescens]MCB6847685.1 hypothetical protein [Weissella viridescens]